MVEQPDLIIMANAEWHSLVDAKGGQVDHSNPPTDAWIKLWSDGFDGRVGRLTGIGGAVAMIGAGPVPSWSGLDPLACIAERPGDVGSCRAQRSTSVPPRVHDIERAIATSPDADFLDPTPWLCGPETCPAVIGNFIVYADGSGHLTTPFVVSLADRLRMELPFPDVAQPRP
jgi:hypothetical protein